MIARVVLPERKPASKKAPSRNVPTAAARRVCRLGNKKVQGVITIAGVEQSEVLWDSGVRQYENNNFLLYSKT